MCFQDIVVLVHRGGRSNIDNAGPVKERSVHRPSRCIFSFSGRVPVLVPVLDGVEIFDYNLVWMGVDYVYREQVDEFLWCLSDLSVLGFTSNVVERGVDVDQF